MAVNLNTLIDDDPLVGFLYRGGAAELETRIATIYKDRIGRANSILDATERVGVLSTIARDLFQCGDVPSTINDAKKLGMADSDMARVLVRHGYALKALSVAQKIPDLVERENVLREVYEIGARISQEGEQSEIFATARLEEAQVNQTAEELIQTAKQIADQEKKNIQVLYHLLEYAEKCDVERSLIIAENARNDEALTINPLNGFDLFLERSEVQYVIPLMHMVRSQDLRDELLEELINFAKDLENKNEKDSALRKIIRYCKRCKDIGGEMGAQMFLSNMHERVDFFRNFSDGAVDPLTAEVFED